MGKKTPDELADIVDDKYGDEPIGSEFPGVLSAIVLAGGYKDPAEIIAVKREVIAILKDIRLRRVS